MLDGVASKTLELRLILACAKVVTTPDDDAAIRQFLDQGVDWTVFAGKSVDHGLASLAGHTLVRVAPDLVPDEILEAFRAIKEQTGRTNRARFADLAEVIDALAQGGIDAIPFKGPVLAIQAFGDLGLRVFRDLDFLIRDPDLAATLATLHRLGYERNGDLTAPQFDVIHRLQGQEIIFRKGVGTVLEPHTRLTSIKMALDIDYPALWRRARRTELNGKTMLLLAPEDDLLVLAIHGGKEMWWDIKWACDFAAFIASHPTLDWTAVIARAQAQGCLRMVLLGTALARKYFTAAVPDPVIAAERADPIIAAMVGRIMEAWLADETTGPPSNLTLSMDRLRLHDGAVRRARYVARTVFLPGPQHVAAMPLPRGMSFAYVPLKIAHDVVALPLWRAYRQVAGQVERLPYALAGSDLALSVMPISAEKKLRLQRNQKLAADAKRALAADPNNAAAWRSLGDALAGLKRQKQAIACYDKALALMPHNTTVWKKRAVTMETAGKAGALDAPLDPDDADAWSIHAHRLFSSKRFGEAVEASDRALALDPGNVRAARVAINSRLFSCDWRRREDDKRRIAQGVRAGEHNIIAPFFHRTLCDSEAESLVLARLCGAKSFPSAPQALWRGERYRHDKLRIAYLSTDFRNHVVSEVIVGCFEHHDRTRFETTAISLGPNDGSKMRRRIEAAFDRFIDLQPRSDAVVAATLRELEIDIVIDLNGNSGERRPGILALRPAPVQVNYLGYPGTMGMPFVDYIIADRFVIPDENRIHYSEYVVDLPHTFMSNDNKRPIAAETPSRTEAGLPETGFVFACHNHEYKISPEVFEVWMRLLRAVEGSVLWLKALNPSAMSNLWREARAHGVAPERLVFAPHVRREDDHLARLRLADLFVDTLPYNAHATACDALWAGLPVVTCLGNTFPGRVGASLLNAIGLPELVTTSLAEYEALALSLAQDPDRLAAIKAKLARNRDTEPLFDTARFTRDLEAAYVEMAERTRRTAAPRAEEDAITTSDATSRAPTDRR
jgi:protein O-GlcNAc transferase